MSVLNLDRETEAAIKAEPVRYKDKGLQRIYAGMLVMAADPKSTLYLPDGGHHRGALHRCAFWDGFTGVKHPKTGGSMFPKNTQAHACYMAGKEFAKRKAQSRG